MLMEESYLSLLQVFTGETRDAGPFKLGIRHHYCWTLSWRCYPMQLEKKRYQKIVSKEVKLFLLANDKIVSPGHLRENAEKVL